MLFNAWARIIAERRRELGITVEKAAGDARMSVSTWYRMERGACYPAADSLEKIARALKMDPDDLALRYSEDMVSHYRERVRARSESASEPVAAGEVTVAAGASALEIRGVTTATGDVWVNVKDLVDKISEAKTVETVRARPRNHRPWRGPTMIRRRKKR